MRPRLFLAQKPSKNAGKNAKNVVVGVVAAGSIALGAAGSGPPALAFGEGTPADVRALARSTWSRFGEAFPARRGCLRPVTVAGAWELDDRATYDPARSLVTIRIPGTAPNLRATLVHEFAHHLESSCRPPRPFRARFLAAQGLPTRAPWFGGREWEQIPSEQFAEAAAEFVLGRRPSHAHIAVTPSALRAIEVWANAP